jgi:heme-degrading monooxygenase HmoA
MLYARIFQVPLRPGATEQAAELFRTEVGPVLKQQPGYVTSRFLTNADTNRCLAVMLWDNEQHREAAESSEALQQVFDHLQPCFAGPPTIDYYEVAVQVF